jgi:arginyl-tRNA synthetase
MLKERIVSEIEAAVRAERSGDADVFLVSGTTADYRADLRRALGASANGTLAAIAARLAANPLIESAEPGADGVLDLRLRAGVRAYVLREILSAGRAYGRSETGAGKRVLVEFVSANPNAPLSVSHARGGVVGDIVASLLTATGYQVQREFYVNDAEDSRPLRAFARAVLAAYRVRCGATARPVETVEYGGAFAPMIAERLYQAEGDRFAAAPDDDALPEIHRLALRLSEDEQRAALASFGIRFDQWSRESELSASGAVAETLQALKTAGFTSERGGALWLLTTRFGDEADRVLLRADGSATYLAGDLAYHRAKFGRGFESLIDVWSGDHESYVARTRAGLAALGFDPACLDVVVFQPVRVLRDGTVIAGGRDGATANVTLPELIEETGSDAARLGLALAPANAPLDFDIDAVRRSDSPLNAIESFLRDSATAGSGATAPAEPTTAAERRVFDLICDFPGVVADAATARAPHGIAQYAVSLAHTAREAPAGPLRSAAVLTLENALILLGIGSESLPREATA